MKSLNEQAYKAAKLSSLYTGDLRSALRDRAAVVRYPTRFMENALVTAREDFSYSGKGMPHIVIEHRREGRRLEPNRFGFGSPSYGKLADLLVGRITDDGNFQTFWVEGHAYEGWTEAHEIAYDKAAKTRADNLPELKAQLGIQDEPAISTGLISSTSEDGDESGDDGDHDPDTGEIRDHVTMDDRVPQPYAPTSPSSPEAAPVSEGTSVEPTAPLVPEVPHEEPGAAPGDTGIHA